MKNYGLALKNLRGYFQLTQREVADRIGVSNHAVSKWENGVNHLDIDSVRRICEIFGITMEQFFRVAAGESVEWVLRKSLPKEETAVTEAEPNTSGQTMDENPSSTGAGMRSTDSFQMKWWAILLLFGVIAILTAGIVALSLSKKGDTLPQTSSQTESSIPIDLQCEIRYYVDGKLFKTQTVVKGMGVTPITAEKFGHVLKGWYQEDGTERFNFSKITTDINDVHAVFKPIAYTAVFLDNEGNFFSQDLQYGQQWKFPTAIFTKKGYVLTGWTDGKKTYPLGAQGVYLAQKEWDRVVLNAVWEELPPGDYTVEFLLDTGEFIEEKSYYYEDFWTVPSCFIARNGYQFDCWECDGEEYFFGESVCFLEGTEYTLVARYKPIRFHILFCESEYGSQREAIYLYDGVNYLRSNLFDDWRAGEYIKGWIIDGVFYEADAEIGNLASREGATFWAIAVWEQGVRETYSLWFEEDYGDVYGNLLPLHMRPIKAKLGETILLPACEYEREGYTFVGWEYEGTREIYQAGEAFTLKGVGYGNSQSVPSTTFIPVWRANTYTVIYQSDLHEDTMSETFFCEGTNYLSNNAHTSWWVDGYKLVGWEIDGKRYETGAEIGVLTTIDGDIIYAKAIWEKR